MIVKFLINLCAKQFGESLCLSMPPDAVEYKGLYLDVR